MIEYKLVNISEELGDIPQPERGKKLKEILDGLGKEDWQLCAVLENTYYIFSKNFVTLSADQLKLILNRNYDRNS